MHKIVLLFLFFSPVILTAQTSQTRYFSNKSLQREVSAEKAKYSQTVNQKQDGSVTTVIKDLRTNEIISSQTYINNEPTGTWITMLNNVTYTLNYSFPLAYTGKPCRDSVPDRRIRNYFTDNDSIHYKAPVMTDGTTNLYQYLSKNIVYPPKAREEGISGKVFLQFNITEEGTISNVYVLKGADVTLDKEAVRVIREIKFLNAPTLEGKPIRFCVIIPIGFKIR